MGEYAFIICRHCSILYKEHECPWIWVSVGLLEPHCPSDTEGKAVGKYEGENGSNIGGWGEFANSVEVWWVSYRMGTFIWRLWREVNGSRVAPWRRLFQAEEQHLQKLHGVDVLGMPRAQQEAVLTGTAEESRAECFVICHQNCSFSLSTIRTHYWGSSRSYNSLKVYNFHSIIFPQLQPMSLDFPLWRRHLVLNKMQHPLIPTGTDVFPHSIEGEMEGVSKG